MTGDDGHAPWAARFVGQNSDARAVVLDMQQINLQDGSPAHVFFFHWEVPSA